MSYTIAIPDKLMERIEAYYKTHDLGFTTKSETVKHIIREFLKDNGGGRMDLNHGGEDEVEKI